MLFNAAVNETILTKSNFVKDRTFLFRKYFDFVKFTIPFIISKFNKFINRNMFIYFELYM